MKENILKKIFNNRNLKIINIIMILVSLIIFEFGVCNHTFTESKLNRQTSQFYFSICRGVIYFIIIVITFIISLKYNFENISKSFENKGKRLIFYSYIVLMLFAFLKIVLNIMLKGRESIFLPQISMFIILLIGGLFTAIYISKNMTCNLVSLIIISTVLSITCTAYNVIDEKRHFMEAYNISYFNFDSSNYVVDTQFMQLPRGTHYTQMIEQFKNEYKYEHGEIPVNDYVDSTPAGYNIVTYIPSAIGIFIGRALKGSVADVFYLGRLCNLLTYIAISVLILKILPGKKNIFFVILAMPMILTMAGTYSSDAIGVCLLSLFIAYSLKLYKNRDDITMKNLAVLIILYCITLSFKSMSYFFIGFIVFILPIKDIIKKNKMKILYLILIFVLGVILVFALQPKIDMSVGDSRGGDTNPGLQIENLIQNPKIIIKVIFNHITGTLLNYDWLKDMHFSLYFPSLSSNVFLFMLLFYFYVAVRDDSINFKTKDKIILFITFLGIYGVTSLALYLTFTPVGSEIILGYPSRYIFPIVSLLLISVSNNKLKTENKDEGSSLSTKIAYISELVLLISAFGAIYN